MNFELVLKASTVFVVSLFILATLSSELVEFYTDQLGGDIITLKINYKLTESYYIFSSFLGLTIFCYFFVFFLSKIKLKNTVTVCNMSYIHYVFFLIAILYAISIFVFGVGVLSNTNRNRIVELIFAMLQPAFILPVYFLFYYSSRSFLYYTTLVLFVVSVLFAGFSTYFILISPIFFAILFRLNLFVRIILIIIAIITLPILRIVKFAISRDLDFSKFFELITFENLIIFGRIILDRFSYLANVKYMLQNPSTFEFSYSMASLNPLYANYVGSLFYSALYGVTDAERNINGLYNSLILGSWKSNTYAPLLSQLYIDPVGGVKLLFSYLLICTCMNIGLMFIGAKRNFKMFITIVPLVLYCLPGFYWPYMNFIQAVFVFIALTLLIKYSTVKN